MKTKYYIERGDYVAEVEFDSQEQFDEFLKSCQKECDYKNPKEYDYKNPCIQAWAEHKIYLGQGTYYTVEVRDAVGKTDDDLRWETQCPEYEDYAGIRPLRDLTIIYPESVYKDNPTSFDSKRVDWENRQKHVTWNKDGIDRMEHFLGMARHIRARMKIRQRAPRTKDVDLERAVDYHLIDCLPQGEAAIKAGVPANALSRGKGQEILEKRANEVRQSRLIQQDDDDNKSTFQPRIQRKELEGFHKSETLRQGKEKD